MFFPTRATSKVLLVGALTLILGSGAFAQSTDPSHPTPWSGFGINSHGPGRDIVYWYSVNSPAGNLSLNLSNGSSPSESRIAVEVFDSNRNPLGRVEAPASARNSREIAVPRRQNLLMAITVSRNTGDYSVWLQTPRAIPIQLPKPEEHVNIEALKAAARGQYAPPSNHWENSGSGGDRAQDFYYPITVHPGALQLQVTAQARSFSTAVTLDIEDESGNSLRRAAAIATTSPTTENATWNFTERRSLRLHVRVMENCSNYRWSIDGPIEH